MQASECIYGYMNVINMYEGTGEGEKKKKKLFDTVLDYDISLPKSQMGKYVYFLF